jgi:hypothetical protein
MLKEGSCDVETWVSRRLISEGRQSVSVVACCRSCGAGSIEIKEGSSLLSFTTTGFPFGSCGALGGRQWHQVEWPARPTPYATPEQPGSCKPA